MACIVAPCLVEGTVGAHKIQGIVFSGIPDIGSSAHLEADHQVVGFLVGGIDDAAFFVAKCQVVCANIEVAVCCFCGILWHWQPTINDGEGGTVFELCRLAVLNTYHSTGEDGESCVARGDNCCRICLGIEFVLGSEVLRC